MVDFFGLDIFTLAFDGIALVIGSILGWYIGRWAKNRRGVKRVGTVFANLDPKTGYSQVTQVPEYNELPASIRYEDQKGHMHRRNTQGHPTFTVDFTTAAKNNGGIERMYIAPSNSKNCLSSEELCGQKFDDTDLTFIADHDEALWAEAGTEMESNVPHVKAILWQLVLGGLAGFAIGVFALALIESRQAPVHPTNATETAQVAFAAFRMVVGK